MASRWFRLYDETLNDPKILGLSDAIYRQWTRVLCVASKNGGYLPSETDLAFHLRFTSVSLVRKLIKTLLEKQLLDETDGGQLIPHNWRKRQYKSDVSTERVKQFRKRQRNVSVNVSETPTDTDTEIERKMVPKKGTTEDSKIKANGKHPELDQEAQLYQRAKDVFGPRFGGQVKRLLISLNGNIAKVRAAVETASSKGDPRAYFGAIVREAEGNSGREMVI
jgi:hypothetical protein